ncbi:hypothetical protein AMECASPLE_015946 [Ameca splendens]|uniref:Uncharacterized protein n=1 Tax=Ameca splendens TaxID=208324 RepID=A0ABV0XRA3_9TELE
MKILSNKTSHLLAFRNTKWIGNLHALSVHPFHIQFSADVLKDTLRFVYLDNPAMGTTLTRSSLSRLSFSQQQGPLFTSQCESTFNQGRCGILGLIRRGLCE